jgi:hypothetical protein
VAKLISLSLILFSVLVPIAVSAGKNPKRTLRNIQIATFFMTLLWAYALMTYYPQYVDVKTKAM